MSAVTARTRSRWQYARVLAHLVSTRAVEVGALQACPLLGAWLGGTGLHVADLGRLGLLLLGSIALTAHVFVFNDWADYHRDARDERRANAGVNGYGARRDHLAGVALVLLVLAIAAFAAIGTAAVFLGLGVAGLSLLYSFSPVLGKRTPVAASLNHLLGGALHFLLGFSVAHGVDARGCVLSLIFGLVFAAGHLNQEVRDCESDRANGVGTVAVTFGPRRGFLVSLSLFSAAYVLIVGLAAFGVLSRLLLLSALVWLVQARWSIQTLRQGLRIETAMWMQRRYRLLFALVGLMMLVR